MLLLADRANPCKLQATLPLTQPGRANLSLNFSIFVENSLRQILQRRIDLLAGSSLILLYFIHKVRSRGIRAPIAIVHIRKFFKMYENIVRFRFFFRIARRSLLV